MKIHVTAVSLYQCVEKKLEGIFPLKNIVRILIEVCWQFEVKQFPALLFDIFIDIISTF